jgi:hypothetical protein
MANPWNLDELEIVGYANVLTETMLPSVVPPVFRLKADHGRALVPPYHINGRLLWNATQVPDSELEDLRDSEEITLFHDAFPACGGHELWVDDSFQIHYQPQYEAEEELGRIATESIQGAEDALRRGDIEQAEHLSGVAICANDRRVEPLAIKAAICRSKEDWAGERLMGDLAAPRMKERPFRRVVDDYYALLPHCSSKPMWKMARCRPAA